MSPDEVRQLTTKDGDGLAPAQITFIKSKPYLLGLKAWFDQGWFTYWHFCVVVFSVAFGTFVLALVIGRELPRPFSDVMALSWVIGIGIAVADFTGLKKIPRR